MNQKPITDNFPTGYSPTHLQHNLEALAVLEPKLVQRISWPVDGSHVLFNGDNPIRYRLHFSLFPLDLSEAQCHSLIVDTDPTKPFFVFGFGLGEIVDILLERFPARRILAWEKDPWLLRCFLMRKDYSKPISERRLRLFLGMDLLPYLPDFRSSVLVFHPFLKNIYGHEADWLSEGVGPRRILFGSGGLFVDQVADSLKERGYSLFFLNLNGVSIEEIEYSIRQFRPQMIFCINYQNGLAELCEKFSLTLACWEIDSILDCLPQTSAVGEKIYIFTYRKENCLDFRQAGFKQVQYLPLAADPDSRSPQTLTQPDQAVYSAPIAFVGNILWEQALSYKKNLTEAYAAFCSLHAVEPPEDPFDKILAKQAEDYGTYRLPELFDEYLRGFKDYFYNRVSNTIDPVRLLAEFAAADKRLTYVSRLADLGIKVWGDSGWKTRDIKGLRYMGLAGHHYELTKIYNQARINLDINRLYQFDMANMRIFDVLACGGFLLAEYTPALEELFEMDIEIITYRTSAELRAKAQYYLAHPDEARAVALRGMQVVREKHTIRKRVDHILRVIEP